MQVMLSLKDSRHGLSSIYSLFLHFEKSATFGTVGYSKVFYGNTQWNFSLCWSAWTFFSFRPHSCMRWRCSLLRCLQRRGGDACKRWDRDEFSKRKRTLLSSNSRRSLHDWGWGFVWLWMSPQESKGVYKLVPVASQIFLLTVAQLFCLSLTSRSQVTLSRVTLLLITQWLRHLFRWANASASDYYIISSPLLQLYMLQPDQLLHSGCEEEREALFLFFDWRSSVTAPIEDCTSLYVFMERFNGQSSLRVYHSTLLLFAGVEQKPHVQTKLDNLLVLQSLFLWVSQTIMPAFSSLRFSCLHFPLSGFHYRCDC